MLRCKSDVNSFTPFVILEVGSEVGLEVCWSRLDFPSIFNGQRLRNRGTCSNKDYTVRIVIANYSRSSHLCSNVSGISLSIS